MKSKGYSNHDDMHTCNTSICIIHLDDHTWNGFCFFFRFSMKFIDIFLNTVHASLS